jgi:AcrR family transcriptional regulator
MSTVMTWRKPIRGEGRTKLLRSALHLFAQHGYAATSVRMIAREAGVSQALLYNWYDGKEALLRAIFERSRAEVRAALKVALGAPTARQGLEVLVKSALRIVREEEDVWRLSYQLRLQPDVLADLGGEIGLWSDVIVPHAVRLFGGTASARAQAEAHVLFAALDGAAQHYVSDPEHYPLDDVADALIRRFAPAEAA